MAQLVYYWIEKFRNLKDSEFNFGSEYLFERDDNELSIKAISNKEYVSNFFSLDSKGKISNISAIVGENASGKSSTLIALKECLNDDRSKLKYAIIYYEKGKHYLCSNKFDCIHFDSGDIVPRSQRERLNTIFYSSIIDLSVYPLGFDQRNAIDVSSNWLLESDSHQQVRYEDKIHNMVEYHKWKDTDRQIEFISSLNEQTKEELEKYITIPNKVRIYSYNSKYDDDSGRVTPNTKELFRELRSKFYTSETFNGNRFNEDDIDNPIYDNDQKNKYKIVFLEHLAWQVRSCFEVEGPTTLHMEEMPSITVSDIKDLRAEESFIKIMNSQSYLQKEPILALWTKICDAIDNNAEFPLRDDNIVSCCFFDVNYPVAIEIMNLYREYINSVYTDNLQRHCYNKSITPIDHNYSFIHFDWSELSTGEKAYLNLFSRMHYAKKIVEEKGDKKLDILILIDEGEIGFHLQWQKEYIYNLVKILPKIFVFEHNITPNIQIIFTTHSPISLSDIPRTNVIYLKDGCVEQIFNQKSFAGNIHSMMKHSFYMRGGLIGKFANKKLDSLIKELKKKRVPIKKMKEIDAIINIVDEPIIRIELERLADKHRGEKERLLQQKENIELRLKELDND